MFKLLAVTCVMFAVLTGCTSTSNLPARADDVDFALRGRSKARLWHDGAVVKATDENQIIAAAQTALKVHGLKVKSSDPVTRAIIASKGFTMTTWNVVVGVYFRQQSAGTFDLHVASQNDKDINSVLDDSQDPFPPKIISSIKNELESQSR